MTMYDEKEGRNGQRSSEETPLMRSDTNNSKEEQSKTYQQHHNERRNGFLKFSQHWVPGQWDVQQFTHHHRVKQHRSFKRRVFLLLTEPDTSIASAVFFVVLIVTISVMNIVMMMQTMKEWQFTPTDCRTCGGPVSYMFDDDDSIAQPLQSVQCVCPPTPLGWTISVLDWLVYFFTIEWTLRVLTFEPPLNERKLTAWGRFCDWFGFLTCTTTVLDALAIFPYYIELTFQTNGLMSLRLLRLFRVFQLVRLGQYNATFTSLTTVLFESVLYLKILLGVLLFGAAFFGSMLYWLEKGDWEYYEPTQSYQFVRTNSYGEQEISPFRSIPETFYWFFVTATTVGYGDTYPTTSSGKWVATLAMLTGVLVIAFPVSVFSDLWSKELRKAGAIKALDDEEEEEEDDDDDGVAEKEKGFALASFDTFPADHETEVKQYTIARHRARQRELSDLDDTNLLDSDHIVMHKDDLADIIAHVQTIQETQKQIRAILKKYKPHHSFDYS